jgi:hypothetical protein
VNARAFGLGASLAAALLVMAGAGLSAAADMSGPWNIDGSVQGHPVKYGCTFQQDGENLTGTAVIETREIPVTGSVTGSEVTWTLEVDQWTLVFAGTLDSDDAITGTIAVAGAMGDFTAARQK